MSELDLKNRFKTATLKGLAFDIFMEDLPPITGHILFLGFILQNIDKPNARSGRTMPSLLKKERKAYDESVGVFWGL